MSWKSSSWLLARAPHEIRSTQGAASRGRSQHAGHVLDRARELQPAGIHVVIGHGADQVRRQLAADDVSFVVQAEQLGTGHAVAQAAPALTAERVLILYGDVPLIQTETLQRLLQQVDDSHLALLTVELDDPTGYGRILRDEQGRVTAIVEHKDASDAQRAIREGNTGILAVPGRRLADWLGRLSNSNARAILPDRRHRPRGGGRPDHRHQPPADAMEVQGANDRRQLAQLERHFQQRAAERLMLAGRDLLDPLRFDQRGQVEAGRDVSIDVTSFSKVGWCWKTA